MTVFHGKRLLLYGLALFAALIVVIQIYPNPAFVYSRAYRGVSIGSDRPIDPSITRVIDDSLRRLATSSMYRPGDRFHIFLCNSNWRLRLFAFDAKLGGATIYATRRIFIRSADISANMVIAPNGGILLDQRHRPLSYFIAHEATHVLLLRRYGMMAMLRSPFWLVEGYADSVAKAGDFNVSENRVLLRRGDPLLGTQMARHGLYRRYQLMVETALRQHGATIDTIFADPPSEDQIVREALR